MCIIPRTMEPTTAPAPPAEKNEVEERIAEEYGLDVQTGKPQGGRARIGTLENPEVYPDVPGEVIPIIEREFDDFDGEAAEFLDGNIPEDLFIGFRLKQGVYGQRQPGVQMCRIKLPMGGVTPDQMDMLADVIEEWAPLNKGHITTRQNIQIHHVPLTDMAKLIRKISDAGLSTREGCGNTVRNVTGDPWAGISEGEPFDITPYAGAFVRYFVRHPTTQLMPRKVKPAFTGTPQDVAITRIHDIGFIARERDGVRGVEIVVGGGTSIMPRVAPTLFEFVELDNGDYLKVSEAVFRLFDRQEWLRVNRARARIKVLVDKVGIENFRAMVEEELRGDWVKDRDFSIDRLLLHINEEENAPGPVEAKPVAPEHAEEFARWAETNTKPQRQAGFSTATVRVIRGDLTPEQFRGLANIMRDFSGGFARTTVQQNLVLRWVRNEALYDVWLRLRELNLAAPDAFTVADVVSCPGTDSCKMGITSSMGLNRAVQERIEQMNITDPLTRQIHIKMSGCPNGCSQHHVGSIGFYGASIKVGSRTIPAYIPHIGGNFTNGDVAFGARLKLRMPAKRVPEAVERWIRLYEAERNDGETFREFAERVGTAKFEEVAKDLTLPIEFNLENMNMFIDWNRSDPYEVQRGEGECAV